jgi:DNA-binding GntR family transcriptional regulator
MKKTALPAEIALSFDDNAPLPVNQQVFFALRQAIIKCVLLPGTSLSEKEVSALFGVSRQPVREAFIKLAEAGLIRILPQRGSFVCKISLRQVKEGRFIREAVESAIISKAAELIQPAQLSMLEWSLAQQQKAVEQRDFIAFLEMDDKFHALLAEIVDCPRAWIFLENIKAHMDRVRYLTLGDISPLDELYQQHANIVESLRTHDAAQAVSSMHRHLRELQSTLEQVGRQHADWFEL